jgi:XRE family transcriptional regulator, regulator of sulfur utilization
LFFVAVSQVPKHRRILGRNIRTHRKRAGLSQEKLAEKADLHPVYLSTVERGVKTISFDALVRIAKSLGVGLGDLFRGCLVKNGSRTGR